MWRWCVCCWLLAVGLDLVCCFCLVGFIYCCRVNSVDLLRLFCLCGGFGFMIVRFGGLLMIGCLRCCAIWAGWCYSLVFWVFVRLLTGFGVCLLLFDGGWWVYRFGFVWWLCGSGVCRCVCISAYGQVGLGVDCGFCVVIWCWHFGLWCLVLRAYLLRLRERLLLFVVWVIARLPACSGFWVGWVWIWCAWVVVGLGLVFVDLGFAYAECFGVWGLGFCAVGWLLPTARLVLVVFLGFWRFAVVVGWYNIGFGCWFWVVSIVEFWFVFWVWGCFSLVFACFAEGVGLYAFC